MITPCSWRLGRCSFNKSSPKVIPGLSDVVGGVPPHALPQMSKHESPFAKAPFPRRVAARCPPPVSYIHVLCASALARSTLLRCPPRCRRVNGRSQRGCVVCVSPDGGLRCLPTLAARASMYEQYSILSTEEDRPLISDPTRASLSKIKKECSVVQYRLLNLKEKIEAKRKKNEMK